MPDALQRSYDGLVEWATLSDVLLRGLVHALNNRLTALSAYSELAALGDEEFAPERILPAELKRLQRVNREFRLLIGDSVSAEAMEVTPLLEDAIALYAHQPRMSMIRHVVSREGTSTPVRAPRWAIMRLLLVLLDGGARAAEAERRAEVAIRVVAEDETLLIAVARTVATPYAEMMAHQCGATLTTGSGGVEVRLPSLAALRARERSDAVR